MKTVHALLISATASSLCVVGGVARASPPTYDVPAAPVMVHALFRDDANRRGTVFERGPERLVALCRLPCELDRPVGARVTVVLDELPALAQDVVLTGDSRSVTDVTTSVSEAQKTVGTVMVGVGLPVTILGGLAFGGVMASDGFFKDPAPAVTGIIAVSGAVALALGIFLLVEASPSMTLSQEPRRVSGRGSPWTGAIRL